MLKLALLLLTVTCTSSRAVSFYDGDNYVTVPMVDGMDAVAAIEALCAGVSWKQAGDQCSLSHRGVLREQVKAETQEASMRDVIARHLDHVSSLTLFGVQSAHRWNEQSWNGEDGVLAFIFSKVGVNDSPIFVQAGVTSTGFVPYATRLMRLGFNALLIHDHMGPNLPQSLKTLSGGRADVLCIQSDSFLASSIDAAQSAGARVLIVGAHFRTPAYLRQLIEQARENGWEFVAHTGDLFFVRSSDATALQSAVQRSNPSVAFDYRVLDLSHLASTMMSDEELEVVIRELTAIVDNSGDRGAGGIVMLETYDYNEHGQITKVNIQYRVDKEAIYVRSLLAYYDFQHVIETGLAAGHGSAAMLAASATSKVVSVDFCQYRYERKCGEHLARRFPGRFQLLEGDFRDVLADLAKQPTRFGFLFHDTNNGFHMEDFQHVSECGGLVFGDWISSNPTHERVWNELKEAGVLHEVECVVDDLYVDGEVVDGAVYCVGMFTAACDGPLVVVPS